MNDTIFNKSLVINCRGRLIDLSTPVVMGILNITPDSFFDGGKFTEEESIVKQVKKMIDEGAAIIDIGASSSRPGAREIGIKEELTRLIPIVKMLVAEFPAAIFSIDTYHAETAQQAVNNGAHMVNDISGGSMDSTMFEVVAELQVPYILMHMKGTPADMQFNPVYTDIVLEIMQYFIKKMERLRKLHVKDIIVDPGFGFGKTVEHNYNLLNRTNAFKILEVPLMAGLSRKSMVWKVLGKTPEESLNGSTVLHTIAIQNGANILRVHDVKEAVECIKLLTYASHITY